jgi:hypothetical protein
MQIDFNNLSKFQDLLFRYACFESKVSHGSIGTELAGLLVSGL